MTQCGNCHQEMTNAWWCDECEGKLNLVGRAYICGLVGNGNDADLFTIGDAKEAYELGCKDREGK